MRRCAGGGAANSGAHRSRLIEVTQASQPAPQMAPSRVLVAFAALSACYFAHIGFFNPYLPLWLKEQGFGLFAISVLTSIQASTRLFAPYVWGAISDHTGERVRLLRFSAAVACVLSVGTFFTLGPWALGVVLFLMFTHTSSMMSLSEAAMAHLVSRNGSFDARRYGRVRLWGSAGFLVMVFLAGAWFEHHGMGQFPAWTVLSLLLVWICTLRLPDLKEPVVHAEGSAPLLPVLRQPVVQWLFASLFFHILSHMGIYIFFSLYLDDLGYSKTMIGVLWAVSVVAEIVWFFTQSRWMPRASHAAWLAICAAAAALRLAMTAAAADHLWVLLLAQALHALTFAAHHTSCIAMVSAYFPARLRGRGQALFTVVGYGLSGVLGGLGGGILSAHWGFSAVYWASCATSLIALVCAGVVWRSSQRRL